MTPTVPMVDLAARHAAAAHRVEPAALQVLRSGQYVGGPMVEKLEGAVAAAMGCAHGVALSSGTLALKLGLQSVGVGPGDEVVLPAVTFFATAGAVVELGATPVVVDVCEDRPLLDPALAAAAVGPRTAAVVPVHLFGNAAPRLDVSVPVVDDSAQAMGASTPVGMGRVQALSLYPTKVLGTAGEGGMVLTDDLEIARRVRALRNHGRVDGVYAVVGGTNGRLGSLGAAIALAHLETLHVRLTRRRQIARLLDEVVAGFAVPRDAGSPVSVYAIRHPDRTQVAQALAEAGIETQVYYPVGVQHHPALRDHVRVPAPTPVADAFCAQTLALPCHADLSDAQLEHLFHTLGAVL